MLLNITSLYSRLQLHLRANTARHCIASLKDCLPPFKKMAHSEIRDFHVERGMNGKTSLRIPTLPKNCSRPSEILRPNENLASNTVIDTLSEVFSRFSRGKGHESLFELSFNYPWHSFRSSFERFENRYARIS